MKKSFDINVTSYDAKTVVSIIQPDEIHFLTGEEIDNISIQTTDNHIHLWIHQKVHLVCHNAHEWNKAKALIIAVMPDHKTLHWHKKKFKAHPCYQDYSKP